ncbi:DUF6064 family protein [Gimibacter soli]|uniref:DUF6064 family protein n=1 Tax=Gimibacter soli TaxID=3024400 RepID=A0AAE9XK37_9PROT|nr:DUF6064 family protein [Gimibacter soli]WCL52639.1 DUF6064 family protein [Gimibacter soli]
MGDWLSYSIQDFLMYGPDTYYRLYGLYSAELFPFGIAAILATLGVVYLLFRPVHWYARAIAVLMAAGWAATGIGFFHRHYATINWAGDWFAAAFLGQAILFLWLVVRPLPEERSRAGALTVLTALVVGIYLPMAMGRPLDQAEVPLLAPDPTVLMTFGVLMAYGRRTWPLAVIPLLWAIVGGAFLWALGSPVWWLMPAGAVGLFISWWRR